jgi:hypothetical protein
VPVLWQGVAFGLGVAEATVCLFEKVEIVALLGLVGLLSD